MYDHRILPPIVLLALAFGVVGGCQSSPIAPSIVTVPPPTMPQPDGNSVDTAREAGSSADEIAARARRDLLESMSLGSEPADQGTTPLVQGPAEEVITWNGVKRTETTVTPSPLPAVSAWTPGDGTETGAPDINTLCNQLAQALYERSLNGDGPMRDLTVLAALSMLDRDRALQPTALESLTAEQRVALESLQQWFLAMEGQLENKETILSNLSEAAMGFQASLRKAPEFGLTSTSLATRVGGYGDVDEWTLRSEADDYNFIAHSSQEVILYLELEGFDSRMDEEGQWSTSTSQQLTIYSDRDGIPVWREVWQTANDQSNSRRNDYFTVQKVKFPTNLSVGKYQLKVRVRDEQSRAESETIIPFVMTATALTP